MIIKSQDGTHLITLENGMINKGYNTVVFTSQTDNNGITIGKYKDSDIEEIINLIYMAYEEGKRVFQMP